MIANVLPRCCAWALLLTAACSGSPSSSHPQADSLWDEGSVRLSAVLSPSEAACEEPGIELLEEHAAELQEASLLQVDWRMLKEKPEPYLGLSPVQINRVDCIVAVLLVVSALIGAIAGWVPLVNAKSTGRPRPWVFAVLAYSYILLIPGLCRLLFSFKLQVKHDGVRSDLGEKGALAESMLGLVKKLYNTGGWLGAVLVVFYAIVVPVVKLLLLLMGELWRHSDSAVRQWVARQSILAVQRISKWACPDMFAYIMILYLFRDLDDRSSVLGGPAHLDVGFSCFSVFCLSSTLTSLAIQPPGEEEAGESKAVDATAPTNVAALPWRVRNVDLVTSVLAVLFGISLALGAATPMMGMRFDVDLLVQPRGPLPATMKPVLDGMHLEKEVNADVSLWRCVLALLRWLHHGELTCVFALVMLAIFCMVLPVVSVVILLAASLEVCKRSGSCGRELLAASRVLRHVAMLDVCLMGVIVVCIAGNAYNDEGVHFVVLPGLAVLVLAEVVHLLISHLVCAAADAFEALR